MCVFLRRSHASSSGINIKFKPDLMPNSVIGQVYNKCKTAKLRPYMNNLNNHKNIMNYRQ